MATRARTATAPPRAERESIHLSEAPTFARYVAIGDSSTEGFIDPDGRGGYRGWSLRLAEHIAAGQPELLYANLAVRGARTREIVEHQLARALAMKPELATVFSGTNDVMATRFDRDAFAADVLTLQRSLRATGATVLTFTLPDLTPLMPLARWFAPRIRDMNAAVRAACAETGTRLVDFAAWPVSTDARLWDSDRIHANSAGHARIAEALAEALGLAGASRAWQVPLPERPARAPGEWLAGELQWGVQHLLPWCLHGVLPRRATTTSAGKRPELTPLVISA